ncbi:hypothetical protein BV22DRAFT_229196 [Leucogyrophana mollusca]|uniref:Uncharacterized protein n=1 Tax=Leucogyrophana mollusca TaxID=85980 RepID=A0ACB8BS70_9AGAM|nr:hypothetical protein BV22DRAFT_229196 [Leucogyrophana mollusca]
MWVARPARVGPAETPCPMGVLLQVLCGWRAGLLGLTVRPGHEGQQPLRTLCINFDHVTKRLQATQVLVSLSLNQRTSSDLPYYTSPNLCHRKMLATTTFFGLLAFASIATATSTGSCVYKKLREGQWDFYAYNNHYCHSTSKEPGRAWSGESSKNDYGCTTILGDITKKSIGSFVFSGDSRHELVLYTGHSKCRWCLYTPFVMLR